MQRVLKDIRQDKFTKLDTEPRFKLRLTPHFADQKTRFLAETSVPPQDLPTRLTETLDSISQNSLEIDPSSRSVHSLWFSCFRVILPFLSETLFIAFFGAVAAVFASLAAMKLLEANGKVTSLFSFAFVYFFMNCVSHFAMLKNGKLRSWAGLTAETHLVSLISRKLLRISNLDALHLSSGTLKNLITADTKDIGEFIDNFVRNLIPALVTIIVTLPVIYCFSGRAGLIGIAVMSLVLPVSLLLNKIPIYFQTKGLGILDSLTSLLGEWVKNIRLVRYLSWNDAFIDEILYRVNRYLRTTSTLHFATCITFGLSSSWWMIATLSIFAFAKRFDSQLSILNYFESLWLLTFLASYATHLPNTVRLYGLAAPSIKRISNLLSMQEQTRHFDSKNHFNEIQFLQTSNQAKPKKLYFQNVGFTYPHGEEVIRNISLEIDLSQKIALVGEVGSGKSTFLKLVYGSFPPTQGSIQVEFEDGTRGDLWNQKIYDSYRSALAYVPQEPFISSDPIALNISLHPQYDEAEVIKSAYWAVLEADLQSFPQGIQQELGESGINLSGGQKQRLNMARAFYSERDYFILDDPLSAVDHKTETALMNSLIGTNKGFLLVTHRTQEMMRIENVLVMKQGTFIESGNPMELANLPESQFSRVLRAYEKDTALV